MPLPLPSLLPLPPPTEQTADSLLGQSAHPPTIVERKVHAADKENKMNYIKQRHPRQSFAVLVVLAIAMMSSLYLNGMIPPMEKLFHAADTYGEEGIKKVKYHYMGQTM